MKADDAPKPGDRVVLIAPEGEVRLHVAQRNMKSACKSSTGQRCALLSDEHYQLCLGAACTNGVYLTDVDYVLHRLTKGPDLDHTGYVIHKIHKNID